MIKILNKQLTDAIVLATTFHAGQVDKGGNNYILHPLWVMTHVTGLKCKIAAVLHDLLEDTDCSSKDLREIGIEEDIIEVVKVLTRDKNDTYMEYIEKVKENHIARKVKLVDLEHNMDLTRVPDEDIEVGRKRNKKYQKAYNYLVEDELIYD